MANWSGLAGILACFVGALIGRYATHLPLPYPATVLAEDWDPELVAKFGSLEGPLATNTQLRDAVRLFDGKVQGSESVTVAPDGALVMCDKFGYVWQAAPTKRGGFDLGRVPVAHLGPGRPLGFAFDAEGLLVACMAGATKRQPLRIKAEPQPAPVAHLGPGRPLGFAFDGEGLLVACMVGAGLVRADLGSGRVEMLTARVSADDLLAPNSSIDYANDVAVAKSGLIYFTDSARGVIPVRNAEGFWDTMQAYMLTLYHGLPSGRLLSYSPATRETHVVAEGFWFANGVALAADEAFAAVVSSNSARVYRVWLAGAKAGQVEVFADGLPGVPDGITRSAEGTFWVGLVKPPVAAMPYLANRFLRFLMARLPAEPLIKRIAKDWGCTVEIGADGKLLRALYDPDGSHISHISAVTDAGGRLYFGNLAGDYVSYVEKPKAA